MYSTADDLLKFSNALFGFRLLKPETLALMLKPGLDKYGYGWWVFDLKSADREFRVAQRPGSVMGANTTLLRVLDDHISIIILSNTNLTNVDEFSFLIGRTLMEAQD